MEIIPAIDLIEGKVVRLTEGDYSKKTEYHSNPADIARQFEDAGLTRLHLVDLDGAKKGSVVNWRVLENIVSNTSLIVDFGGGVKQETDVKMIIDSGARWVTIGSMAVKQPDIFISWVEKYGADKFFLGADVRNEKIAVGGWLETTELNVHQFIKGYSDRGLNYVFCTDISKDGKLEGPATDLYKLILSQNNDVDLVASGGVTTMNDLYELRAAGCHGAIVGKAIYENRITLDDLKKFNA
ncbi:MAG TPA: 1-(5-phosphoribosyl)-5-[(5-phosphoribosylamino)methylideneamino]imidazole-4-carboxamide isomerase [Chitinophagaceae bacterium]|nr:1-(5-phosphoribosyl)-5-[(5-phosphoribosylamino)methylideneamino]imidazole-4-carboxamide isomerase [Chitinophagaceae bacterium]